MWCPAGALLCCVPRRGQPLPNLSLVKRLHCAPIAMYYIYRSRDVEKQACDIVYETNVDMYQEMEEEHEYEAIADMASNTHLKSGDNAFVFIHLKKNQRSTPSISVSQGIT